MKYLTRVRNVNVESEQSEDSLTKDRARTGRSQKIVPGLETFNQVRNVSPDLNEVRVQHLTRVRDVKPGPERSEGAPSQNIGRELEASNIGPSVSANPN